MSVQLVNRLSSAFRARSRVARMRAYLSVRRRLAGRTIWIDHGCIKLPFHGDGDPQEIYYHLDGKEWWNKEVRLMSPYLRVGHVAADVGANLGFITGILSTLTGATGHVYSFEPSPSVYSKLAELVELNRYGNVSCYNMGCGKAEQSMTLYSPRTSGNATLRPGSGMGASNCKLLDVRIVQLDDFLGPKLERLDFLKIDTEGYEDEVLAGASGILRRFQPVIYIELNSEYIESSERAARLLRDYGYTFDRELVWGTSHEAENYFALPRGLQHRS